MVVSVIQFAVKVVIAIEPRYINNIFKKINNKKVVNIRLFFTQIPSSRVVGKFEKLTIATKIWWDMCNLSANEKLFATLER